MNPSTPKKITLKQQPHPSTWITLGNSKLSGRPLSILRLDQPHWAQVPAIGWFVMDDAPPPSGQGFEDPCSGPSLVTFFLLPLLPFPNTEPLGALSPLRTDRLFPGSFLRFPGCWESLFSSCPSPSESGTGGNFNFLPLGPAAYTGLEAVSGTFQTVGMLHQWKHQHSDPFAEILQGPGARDQGQGLDPGLAICSTGRSLLLGSDGQTATKAGTSGLSGITGHRAAAVVS